MSVHYADQFQDSGEKVSARLIWIYTVCKGYTKVYRLLFTFSNLQMQLNIVGQKDLSPGESFVPTVTENVPTVMAAFVISCSC